MVLAAKPPLQSSLRGDNLKKLIYLGEIFCDIHLDQINHHGHWSIHRKDGIYKNLSFIYINFTNCNCNICIQLMLMFWLKEVFFSRNDENDFLFNFDLFFFNCRKKLVLMQNKLKVRPGNLFLCN